MSTWVGKTLGNVRIDSLLAKGGMAVVYVGTHTTLQRKVVIKILRNEFEENTAAAERFQREALVVAQLRHPNIIQIFDFSSEDDQPYLVMEYVDGPSLSQYLTSLREKNARIELPHVSDILTKVAGALQYAHDSHVIHRDVKPANILLSSRSTRIVRGEPLPVDVEPILSDFGLVRYLSAGTQSSIGTIVGTPAYMSPEQAVGEKTDERTDVYSLGIVLYELLAGHVPFDGETTMSVLFKQINQPPAAIPGLSAPLQRVLQQALAKKPEDRFSSVADFATAFNMALQEISAAGTIEVPGSNPFLKPAPTQQIGWRWPRLASLGLVALALGAFVWMNQFTTPGSPTVSKSPTLPTISITVPVETMVEFPTQTDAPMVIAPLGPTGLLQFQDGLGIMDQVTLYALGMPAAPENSHYQAWLMDSTADVNLDLGPLTLDKNGKGQLTFKVGDTRNLLATYDRVELRIQTEPQSTQTPDLVAYSFVFPKTGVAYARELLVRFPQTPQEIAILQGLHNDAQVMDQSVQAMAVAYQQSDLKRMRTEAEALLNLLAGTESPDHKDWNQDGTISDDSDGYGLILNADQLGYIQALYSRADYTVNSPGISQTMSENGSNLKVCAQNLANLASQLQNELVAVVNASDTNTLATPIQNVSSLVDHFLSGRDINNNQVIEALTGECGVQQIYEYAYRMVDMPLLPANGTQTPTASPTRGQQFFATSTPRPGSGGNTGSQPTSPAVGGGGNSTATSAGPGNNPKPTQKPPKASRTPKK